MADMIIFHMRVKSLVCELTEWHHYDENYENNDLQNDNLLPDLEHEVRPPPALSRIGSHRRRLLPQVEINNDHKES